MPHSGAVRDSKARKDSGPAIEVTKDSNGIDQVLLSTPKGATAHVSLLGAQVTSWRSWKGEELLFKSSKTSSKDPKTRLGGIAICFPKFENCGTLEQHGFARKRMWSIDENPPPLPSSSSSGNSNPKSFVDLLLKSSEEYQYQWPHSFELRLRVYLTTDGDLTLISRVRNIDGKPFSFSFSYHTYLLASDIDEIRIEGLETLDYLDNLSNQKRSTDEGNALTFESEVDRFYLSAPDTILVMDHEKRRTYLVRKKGLPDVAVWNPWETAGWSLWWKKEEYKQVLCVDGADVENPVDLKRGEEWTGKIQLKVVPSMLIEPPDGTKWKVYWKKINGEIWFEKGWKTFTQNYSLGHGCLVVFQYEQGTSKFHVLILGQNAVEIDYDDESVQILDEKNNSIDHSDDESVEILDEEWLNRKKTKQKSPLVSPRPHKKVRGEIKKTSERTASSMNWPKEAKAQE
ncbi:putative glucose-6-phosphate 1-epimerase [Trifolium repens]|nr:putative glucose-6-phosphate 1-epimerase [Trifolium repens]